MSQQCHRETRPTGPTFSCGPPALSGPPRRAAPATRAPPRFSEWTCLPGLGLQVRDLDVGILPDGLFRTAQLPSDAFQVSPDGLVASLTLCAQPQVDNFMLFRWPYQGSGMSDQKDSLSSCTRGLG
jgi:hypothetical protein